LNAFRAHARTQAGWCERLGSPFTARLCTLLADRLDDGTELGHRLLNWPGDHSADITALRVCGGLHARVRSGAEPALATLYPPAPLPHSDVLWNALVQALANPALLPWLDSAPQTNEVARSGALMPGLLVAADATGLPLRLFELGASAGLNLRLDHYRYRLGTLETGPADAPLHLAPIWQGADPPAARLHVTARAGVDLNPLDVTDDATASRLLGYVWPDQPERLARAEAAVAAARRDPSPIARGDAADFVERHVAPKPGVTTLVFHSIAFQYFPAEAQARIHAHMERQGAAATPDAPLAWLRYELEDFSNGTPPTLRLRIWPDGSDRLLAHVHPHGVMVNWVA
jgi:hypothetical protein